MLNVGGAPDSGERREERERERKKLIRIKSKSHITAVAFHNGIVYCKANGQIGHNNNNNNINEMISSRNGIHSKHKVGNEWNRILNNFRLRVYKSNEEKANMQ